MTVPGKGGRPAKPTALKLLHGETRPSQVNYNEPQPPQREIEPPEDITEEALEVWNDLADDLIRTGVLKPWDVENYADWCEAVVSKREAQHHLDEEGEVIDMPIHNRDGKVTAYKPVINPWWKVRMEAAARMDKGAAHFGLTPADRTRIQVDQGSPKNKKGNEDLLSG